MQDVTEISVTMATYISATVVALEPVGANSAALASTGPGGPRLGEKKMGRRMLRKGNGYRHPREHEEGYRRALSPSSPTPISPMSLSCMGKVARTATG